MKRPKNLLTLTAIALGFVMVTGADNEAAADRCKPGHKMYKSKNGKSWCCPPGTKGYYDGNTRIRCKRKRDRGPVAGGRINTSGLRFRYVKRHHKGKWYKYVIRLNAPRLARRVVWVEYQRQDDTFPEFKQARYLRRTKGPDFLIWWKGYSNVPIAIRVRFDNGRTKYHRITRGPRVLRGNKPKSSCRPGYKGFVAKSGRVLCCPPGTKGYHRGRDDIVCKQVSTTTTAHNCRPGWRGYKARNGQVMCCPPGTNGYLKGSSEVICKAGANRDNKTKTTDKPKDKPDCKPGWGLYLARSGKKFCCPPGKTGKLRGYSRVVCK